MKFNWGTGIATLYLGFVAMILVLVGMSINQKIDLVTDHYYEEELQFQDKINKISRAASLAEPLAWEVNASGVIIHFPKVLPGNAITGKVRLYCPSNEKNDRTFHLDSKNNVQLIATSKIPGSRYHLQIDWKSGEQTYWNEDVIRISHLTEKGSKK
ncbi:FixH family protein [Dyadobacter sp. NIV53]|uniref:FixH family protein n=1 Tax=Dyadobacter sp. NIV53 TaxID=2861765 RepID=UPI001C887410|nr:FixH family protein [Dyadobacter sp. NIV53]